jgi:hypothetical protein
MADLFENPLGTDGFEFVEYCHHEPEKLKKLFLKLRRFLSQFPTNTETLPNNPLVVLSKSITIRKVRFL